MMRVLSLEQSTYVYDDKRKIRAADKGKKRFTSAKEAEAAKNAPGTDKLETMDDSAQDSAKKATINLKTMKRADGTYPPWMSGSMKNKLSKKNKAMKKKKLQKAKSRR
ncbi:hypothetical protein OSTOST_03904 [Ostertagia ostertagi]